MYGTRPERRWDTVASRIHGYAMLRQRCQRAAGDGTVLDGRCGEGCVVYWIHGTSLAMHETS